MASSPRAREMFDAYVDGELSADERAAFEAAMEHDDALRADLHEYSQTVDLLRELPRQRAPQGFVWMVQQRVRRRTRGRHFTYTATPSLVYEAATCGVLLCIMAGLYLYTALGTQGKTAATSPEERVQIAPADRRFLRENGSIEFVGTTLAGDMLEVHMVVTVANEAAFRQAVEAHSRFKLVPKTVVRQGELVWLTLQTRGSPPDDAP